ncbi:MAG: HIT domain-containing protein [candidate division KSB1 bacterium]|nr:HIT domain-containing protein [candidate division KSB1 bacterium]MDZ7304939.1 HIT domain-containing protein [candidate division KSB1 bacterium]MDZ7311657.1 HIT domain-containing protein [candidate division KSB1 bacterium]
MTDCIFCRIIQGQAPASVVYDDEKTLAFMDTRPVNPGHLLIVPKLHATGLSELDADLGAHLFKAAMRLATALRHSGVKCEGINFFLADGKAAFQEIFHVHLHVIPRFAGDGLAFQFGPDYYRQPSRPALDEVAERIRRCLS